MKNRAIFVLMLFAGAVYAAESLPEVVPAGETCCFRDVYSPIHASSIDCDCLYSSCDDFPSIHFVASSEAGFLAIASSGAFVDTSSTTASPSGNELSCEDELFPTEMTIQNELIATEVEPPITTDSVTTKTTLAKLIAEIAHIEYVQSTATTGAESSTQEHGPLRAKAPRKNLPQNTWPYGTNKFVCHICGKTLSSKRCLKIHILGVHEGRRGCVCGQCGKILSSNQSLQRHQGVHEHRRPFACLTCGLRFTENSLLSRHGNKEHAVTHPFKCDLCYQRFATSDEFETHAKECKG